MTKFCDLCGRSVWSNQDAPCVDTQFCDNRAGPLCVTINCTRGYERAAIVSARQISTLLSIVDKLLPIAIGAEKLAGPELISVLAVIEEMRPTTSCPWCLRPLTVSRGSATVHYARNDDQRPCAASSERVISGYVVRMTKDGLQIAWKT